MGSGVHLVIINVSVEAWLWLIENILTLARFVAVTMGRYKHSDASVEEANTFEIHCFVGREIVSDEKNRKQVFIDHAGYEI